MAVCYNKLWKLLIDRKMKKKDLIEQTGISRTTIAKMGRDENVSTEVLSKICGALQVDVGDIMEMIPDGTQSFWSEEKWYVDGWIKTKLV